MSIVGLFISAFTQWKMNAHLCGFDEAVPVILLCHLNCCFGDVRYTQITHPFFVLNLLTVKLETRLESGADDVVLVAGIARYEPIDLVVDHTPPLDLVSSSCPDP